MDVTRDNDGNATGWPTDYVTAVVWLLTFINDLTCDLFWHHMTGGFRNGNTHEVIFDANDFNRNVLTTTGGSGGNQNNGSEQRHPAVAVANQAGQVKWTESMRSNQSNHKIH